MPINQPTIVDHRPWNNINVSGAILAPIFESAGQMAGQGLKDAFGIQSPQERYYESLATQSQAGLMPKVEEAWQQRLAQADGGQYANDPEFKRKFFQAHGITSDDMLDAAVATSENDTAMTKGMRDIEWSTSQLAALNERPQGPVSQALAGGTGYQAPPADGASASPQTAAVTGGGGGQSMQPNAPSLGTDAASANLTATAQAVQASPSTNATPESVPGNDAPPFDKEAFAQHLQTYRLRAGANLQIMRQLQLAATTGQLDSHQLSLALNLQAIQTRDLTKLMNVAAPALGLPRKDNNGKPINGDVLEQGAAAAMMQTLQQNPERLKQYESTKDGKQYVQGLRAMAQQFSTRLTHMDAEGATRLQDMVKKAGTIISPEQTAQTAYLYHQSAQQKALAEQEDAYRKQHDAQQFGLLNREMILKEKQNTFFTQRETLALKQLEQEVGPEQLQLRLREARARVDLLESQGKHYMATAKRDEAAAELARSESDFDRVLKLSGLTADADTRRMGAYMQQISNMQARLAQLDQVQGFNKMQWDRERDQMLGPDSLSKTKAAVAEYVKTDPEVAKAPFESQFEAWYRNQHPGYGKYADQREAMLEQIDDYNGHLQNVMRNSEKPGAAQALMNARVVPLLRASAKAELQSLGRENWSTADEETRARLATSVNNLVGDLDTSQGGGGMSFKQPWDYGSAQALLALASQFPKGADEKTLAKIPVASRGGKPMSEVIGNRWPEFYNSYTRLIKEMR